MERAYLRATEVAELLGVSLDWVYAHKCELGYVDIGRCIRFDRRSLDRYIAEHTHEPKRKCGRPRKSIRRVVRRIDWCEPVDGAACLPARR